MFTFGTSSEFPSALQEQKHGTWGNLEYVIPAVFTCFHLWTVYTNSWFLFTNHCLKTNISCRIVYQNLSVQNGTVERNAWVKYTFTSSSWTGTLCRASSRKCSTPSGKRSLPKNRHFQTCSNYIYIYIIIYFKLAYSFVPFPESKMLLNYTFYSFLRVLPLMPCRNTRLLYSTMRGFVRICMELKSKLQRQ